MNLTKLEKETIILSNEKETNAEIYTFNKKLIKKIRKASEKHPEIFKIKTDDKFGSVTCEMPKDRLSVNLKFPIKKELSQKRSEQMKTRNKLHQKNAQICEKLNIESAS